MKARHYFNTVFVFLLVSLAVTRVQAMTVHDVSASDFYQVTEYVMEDTLFTIEIDINQAGPYKAKLVDFRDSAPFDILCLTITQGSTVFTPGGLWDTGSFTFDVSNTSDPLVAHLQANPEGGLGLYGLQILPVPLPSTFWLFMSALVGFVTIARQGRGLTTV